MMTIKATVKGKNIYAEAGTKGIFYVNSRKREETGYGAFIVFKTIRAAKAYIEKNPEF